MRWGVVVRETWRNILKQVDGFSKILDSHSYYPDQDYTESETHIIEREATLCSLSWTNFFFFFFISTLVIFDSEVIGRI